METRLQRALGLTASATSARDLCLKLESETRAGIAQLPEADQGEALKTAEDFKAAAAEHAEYAAMFQELVDMYKARGDKVPESASGGCACDGTCGSCSCSAHDHEDIKGQQPV